MQKLIWIVDLLSAARHYQQLEVASLMSNRTGVVRQGLIVKKI